MTSRLTSWKITAMPREDKGGRSTRLSEFFLLGLKVAFPGPFLDVAGRIDVAWESETKGDRGFQQEVKKSKEVCLSSRRKRSTIQSPVEITEILRCSFCTSLASGGQTSFI